MYKFSYFCKDRLELKQMNFSQIFEDFSVDFATHQAIYDINLRKAACHLSFSARHSLDIILLFSIYLLQIPLLFAQDTLPLHYSRTITEVELSEHVYKLASKEFEGRYTGSKGQIRAAEYIMNEFKKDGLEAPRISGKATYTQDYILDNCRWKDQRLLVNGTELEVGKNFLFLSDPVDIRGTYQVIFSGYGIEDSAYSDFKNLDVKGKIMLVFSGEPVNKQGISVISGAQELSKKAYYFSKSAVAIEKGAAGIIIIAREESDFKKFLKNREYYNQKQNISYPYGDEELIIHKEAFSAFMDLKTAAKLIRQDPKVLAATLNEMQTSLKTSAGRFAGTIEIDASSDCFPMQTANIVGVVKGTSLKNEAVVVVAHYDHLGVQNGLIYYGADDNASGTAAVMEIAEAFADAAREGHRPRRTVIFLAVSGEELGLYGSKFYSENPVIPLDNTYACVNIDMIGRASSRQEGDPEYISGFAYVTSDILEVAQKSNILLNPDLEDQMEFRERIRGGSDHYYFARHGIPSLFYFTGLHRDYHEPTDTPDKILYSRMEKIARAIFATTWELANREERLEIGN